MTLLVIKQIGGDGEERFVFPHQYPENLWEDAFTVEEVKRMLAYMHQKGELDCE